jgi:hypothetical protein
MEPHIFSHHACSSDDDISMVDEPQACRASNRQKKGTFKQNGRLLWQI